MAKNIKKQNTKQKDISYTSRDFGSMRNDLKRYVGQYFRDSIRDTTDASLAGMLIDVAAYVGDVTSYYLDYQFNENSIEKAVETKNVERLVRESGVKIIGKSPAVGFVQITLTVPAILTNGEYIPDPSLLPKIKAETIFTSKGGIKFYLTDDVDFSEEDSSGDLIASLAANRIVNGIVYDFKITREGFVTSSQLKSQTNIISDTFEPFRTISIDDSDVNEIVRVVDSDGDDYYEVESLTQSTIFKRMPNNRIDQKEAEERIMLMHAPKRFITTRTSVSGKTTLLFGSGQEDTFDEDIIPDPSEHAVKLYGDKKSVDKITIDPNSFLGTQTLGISPRNTTLTISYRRGGGLNHNTPALQLSRVTTLLTEFPAGASTTKASLVRATASCINNVPILGGEDEPSLESLRQIAIFNKNSQNRIVSREDLIARVYTLPNNFGRVFRAAVRDNPNNPQAAQLFVISRNRTGKLVLSSDTLKENISNYLSKFRIMSDAIDILDASVVNVGLDYQVNISQEANSSIVISAINTKLKDYFKIDNYQIGQPIKIGEIENLILNTPDVESISSLSFKNLKGSLGNNVYSNFSFNIKRNTNRGYLFPPTGGIFEVRYPNDDIVGRVS